MLLIAVATVPPAAAAEPSSDGPVAGATGLADRAGGHPPMWFEVLHTRAGSVDLSRRPIHGRHFGAAAPSLGAAFAITSRPFGARGPFELGNGDLALMRMGPERTPEIGETVTFPVLVAAASWQSGEPVAVDAGDGNALWNVEITLSPMAAEPWGEVTLHRHDGFGGTAEIAVNAFLQYRFYRDDGREIVVDAGKPGSNRGQMAFRAAGVPWSVDCTAAGVRPPRLSDSICLGVVAGGGSEPFELQAGAVQLQVERAVHDAVAPRSRVATSAVVADDAHLGAGATVRPGARVLAGAGLGRGTVVAARATVGEGALVGAGSRLGADARLGRAAYVGENVEIGLGARIEEGVVIHDGTRIGAGAHLAPGVYVGADVVIGAGAEIGANAHIGRRSTIGDNAIVAPGVTIVPGTPVQPGTIQPVNTIHCTLDGLSWVATTVARCERLGGAILDYVPPIPLGRYGHNVSFTPETQQVPQGNGQAVGGQLAQDIDDSGIGDREYVEDDYDCEDFADDLEQHLQAAGWNATFTCVWPANEEHEWYNWLWTPELDTGHCYTDVHLDDGSYVWIEAQWRSDEGAIGQDLDADGDGMVGVSMGHGSDLTEGNARIEVYGSAAEAAEAGVNFD